MYKNSVLFWTSKREALGLVETGRKETEHFTLVYLGDGQTGHALELTWLRDWGKPEYDLGDNEFHLCLRVNDFDAAYNKHKEMGVICYENPGMGLYFIADPDGYWIEIVPHRM